MDSDDKKITQLARVTSLSDSDLFAVVVNIGTAPVTKAIEKSNAFGNTWSDWTPKLYQGGNVASSIVYARKLKIGKTVFLRIQIQASAAGTSGQKILVTNLPYNIANHTTTGVMIIGNGAVLDSATAIYAVAVCAHDATTISFFDSGAADFLGANPAWALANNDTISFTIMYEEA